MEPQGQAEVRDYSLHRIFLSMFTALHMYVCGFLDSQECVRAFQSPCENFISQLFFLQFLVSYLFAPAVSAAKASCDVKQLPLIVFSKCPREKAVHTEQTLSQIK